MSNVPILGNLISPKAPTPPPAPVVASPMSADPGTREKTAAEMEKAAAAQRQAASGGASTLLTGGTGVSEEKKAKTSSTILLGM